MMMASLLGSYGACGMPVLYKMKYGIRHIRFDETKMQVSMPTGNGSKACVGRHTMVQVRDHACGAVLVAMDGYVIEWPCIGRSIVPPLPMTGTRRFDSE